MDLEKFSKLVSDAANRDSEATSSEGKDSADAESNAIAEGSALENGTLLREASFAAEIEAKLQLNEDRKENRNLRKDYATKVYRYLVGYSVFVAILLLLSGFGICGFTLADSVLNFLVGSTAASAIGLVFSVTNGLFAGLEKRQK